MYGEEIAYTFPIVTLVLHYAWWGVKMLLAYELLLLLNACKNFIVSKTWRPE